MYVSILSHLVQRHVSRMIDRSVNNITRSEVMSSQTLVHRGREKKRESVEPLAPLAHPLLRILPIQIEWTLLGLKVGPVTAEEVSEYFIVLLVRDAQAREQVFGPLARVGATQSGGERAFGGGQLEPRVVERRGTVRCARCFSSISSSPSLVKGLGRMSFIPAE